MMRPRCVEMGNVKATRDTCTRRGPGAGSVGAGGGWTGTAAPLNTLHTTAPQELATISRTFHNFWKSLLTFLKYLLVLLHLRIYYTTLKESLNVKHSKSFVIFLIDYLLLVVDCCNVIWVALIVETFAKFCQQLYAPVSSGKVYCCFLLVMRRQTITDRKVTAYN